MEEINLFLIGLTSFEAVHLVDFIHKTVFVFYIQEKTFIPTH